MPDSKDLVLGHGPLVEDVLAPASELEQHSNEGMQRILEEKVRYLRVILTHLVARPPAQVNRCVNDRRAAQGPEQ